MKINQTYKIVFRIFLLLSFYFAGWYIGYENGATNQVYFDAPAKIIMLKKSLGPDVIANTKVINALILNQKCILSDKNYNNSLSIYHPIHEDVRWYYFSNIERVCGKEGCSCKP